MSSEDVDYSGRMCELYNHERKPLPGIRDDWPMYSYSRPGWKFWNGFANALRERGLTDEQIGQELMSKGARWLMDQHGDEVEELGRKLGQSYGLCVTKEATS